MLKIGLNGASRIPIPNEIINMRSKKCHASVSQTSKVELSGNRSLPGIGARLLPTFHLFIQLIRESHHSALRPQDLNLDVAYPVITRSLTALLIPARKRRAIEKYRIILGYLS
jgi:hypothetical protein